MNMIIMIIIFVRLRAGRRGAAGRRRRGRAGARQPLSLIAININSFYY